MSLCSTEMGDHLEIIIFSSILLILLNSLISLRELHKTPIVTEQWSHWKVTPVLLYWTRCQIKDRPSPDQFFLTNSWQLAMAVGIRSSSKRFSSCFRIKLIVKSILISFIPYHVTFISCQHRKWIGSLLDIKFLTSYRNIKLYKSTTASGMCKVLLWGKC